MVDGEHVERVVIQGFENCYVMLVYHSQELVSIFNFPLGSLLMSDKDSNKLDVGKVMLRDT